MKKLALGIVSLVLGTSSLAAADSTVPQAPIAPPQDGVVTRDWRNDRYDDRFDDRFDGRTDRDHRFDDGRFHQMQWINLGSVAGGRQELDLRGIGFAKKLRFDAQGQLGLRRVIVRYADGHEENFKVSSSMTRRPFEIDLANRHRVVSVMVMSRQLFNGWGQSYYGYRDRPDTRGGRIAVQALAVPVYYRGYSDHR